MKKTLLSLILLLAFGFATTRVDAQVSVGISVHIAPPVIPVYEQPPCPVDGYLWIPGYWAWDDDVADYYWVPGYWAAPPRAGVLWTPGYWGWSGGLYYWHTGYWGPRVGYYGGINYGCGYGGIGYAGGEWYGGRFRYNTAVTRVNTTIIHNTYINRTVVNNVTMDRVSYNGGPGGVQHRPDSREQLAMNDRHFVRSNAQLEHQQAAMRDRGSFSHENHGRPGVLVSSRPVAYRAPASPAAERNLSMPQGQMRTQEGRPQGGRPVGVRPQEGRPAGVRPQEGRPQEGRPVGGRPQEGRPVGGRPLEGRPHEGQPQGQPMHGQPQRSRPQGQPFHPQQQPRPMPQQGRPIGHPQERPAGPPHGGGQPHGNGGEHHHG